MVFEGSFGAKMQEGKWPGSSLKPTKFMGLSSRHKRSNSVPEKIVKEDKLDVSAGVPRRLKLDMEQVKGQVELQEDKSPKNELRSSLKKEIVHLEKHLDGQFMMRRTLEKALGYNSSRDTSKENSMPKPANDLIKEIAVLEMEVAYLEQYLLSLYRKAFDQKISSVSPTSVNEGIKSPPVTEKGMILEGKELDFTSARESSEFQFSQPLVPEESPARLQKEYNMTNVTEKLLDSGVQRCHSELSHRSAYPSRTARLQKELNITSVTEKLLDSGVHRCHSELSQRSAYPSRTTEMENLARAVQSCHSQPLSYLEHGDISNVSLADHLGTRISDHAPESPNRISEDMIKCISAIYCKLSDPPIIHHGFSSSPFSSFSSPSDFSPEDQCDTWSPHYRKDSSFDARLDNPFHVESFREFSGPYSTMVEVPSICRDSRSMNSINLMLQNYRSLVSRLEVVDPRRMKHDEKLAFWINIHNALVMHAFLAYGIPQNSQKRVTMLLKSAYNVGGHTISADTIQSSILGCRVPRPGQWLGFLFSTRTKFKARDDRQSYAIEHPEPLLHFALCSGSHSDPAVRIYTPKRITQELDTAKEEYIRASFSVRKEQKILLPKLIESFAKDSGLCALGVVEMIRKIMPEMLWKSMQGSQQWRSRKSVEWTPHNFAFRYLISKELVK